MLSLYHAIMDLEHNPLREFPPAQRFQSMMFLSLMWTTIFCTVAGAWFWYGELVIGHFLVILGFAITGITFRQANNASTYRVHPLTDSTARNDDAWGA